MGELSRNFQGEYYIGPPSAPSLASLSGTSVSHLVVFAFDSDAFSRFFQPRSQLFYQHQRPAFVFRMVSIAFAVAGVAAAAGHIWLNRRFNRNILQELHEGDDDDDDGGIDDLDESQDEPMTPSASGSDARGGNSLPCIVCFERKRRVLCNPCRHFALCVECARRTWDANRRCPCCRADLDGFSRVFLA